MNRNSGKALDVYNLATNEGGRIIQWSRHDRANQQWQFVDSGGGDYRIPSRHSSKALDVHGRSTAGPRPTVPRSCRGPSSWTPHLATESSPFARSNNVTFSGPAWTRDFSHGELIRAGNDQTVPLNPCQLQFLYQGMDPNAGGDYISLPWRMGLLIQTNSTC